jgi:hypothetical protein
MLNFFRYTFVWIQLHDEIFGSFFQVFCHQNFNYGCLIIRYFIDNFLEYFKLPLVNLYQSLVFKDSIAPNNLIMEKFIDRLALLESTVADFASYFHNFIL